MIEAVRRMLQKLRIISSFSQDDMINASIDDKARDHENLLTKLQGTLFKREMLNERMRDSIKFARQATSSFAEFEQFARREERHHHD